MNGRGNLGAKWDLVERITRILSLIAIPVAIAVVGALIQNSIAKRSVSQQYVQVAVAILTSREKVDPNLRNWAVDLLDDNSPTPLGATVRQKLKEGSITLPSQPSPLDTANFRLAQRYLKRLGYYQGDETGVMDDALYQAVKRFQKENGLEVDGYPGGQTVRKMLERDELRP
jgi:murein L,D-transpeptidase YcbB/YkuD